MVTSAPKNQNGKKSEVGPADLSHLFNLLSTIVQDQARSAKLTTHEWQALARLIFLRQVSVEMRRLRLALSSMSLEQTNSRNDVGYAITDVLQSLVLSMNRLAGPPEEPSPQ